MTRQERQLIETAIQQLQEALLDPPDFLVNVESAAKALSVLLDEANKGLPRILKLLEEKNDLPK